MAASSADVWVVQMVDPMEEMMVAGKAFQMEVVVVVETVATWAFEWAIPTVALKA